MFVGANDGIPAGETLCLFGGIDAGKRAFVGEDVSIPLGEPFGKTVGRNDKFMVAKPVG